MHPLPPPRTPAQARARRLLDRLAGGPALAAPVSDPVVPAGASPALGLPTTREGCERLAAEEARWARQRPARRAAVRGEA